MLGIVLGVCVCVCVSVCVWRGMGRAEGKVDVPCPHSFSHSTANCIEQFLCVPDIVLGAGTWY